MKTPDQFSTHEEWMVWLKQVALTLTKMPERDLGKYLAATILAGAEAIKP